MTTSHLESSNCSIAAYSNIPNVLEYCQPRLAWNWWSLLLFGQELHATVMSSWQKHHLWIILDWEHLILLGLETSVRLPVCWQLRMDWPLWYQLMYECNIDGPSIVGDEINCPKECIQSYSSSCLDAVRLTLLVPFQSVFKKKAPNEANSALLKYIRSRWIPFCVWFI